MEISIISEINAVCIRPQEDGLVGFGSCIYNKCMFLGSIAIYERRDGTYRLLYPTKVLKNGTQINIFYPINKSFGESMQNAIVAKFIEVRKIETAKRNLKGESVNVNAKD